MSINAYDEDVYLCVYTTSHLFVTKLTFFCLYASRSFLLFFVLCRRARLTRLPEVFAPARALDLTDRDGLGTEVDTKIEFIIFGVIFGKIAI